MKDWKIFTIGILFGLSITLLIAATSTKKDDTENQRIGKYQMAISLDDQMYVINTTNGRIHLMSPSYKELPITRWPGFEGPEAEKALKQMQKAREQKTREKSKDTETKRAKAYYDLSKVWVLQATIEESGVLHAIIKDKGQPDPKLKRPYTIHQVKKGDIIESSDRLRVYKVEILEVKKNSVKFYRHDMDDRTEEKRTFELKVWPDSE